MLYRSLVEEIDYTRSLIQELLAQSSINSRLYDSARIREVVREILSRDVLSPFQEVRIGALLTLFRLSVTSAPPILVKIRVCENLAQQYLPTLLEYLAVREVLQIIYARVYRINLGRDFTVAEQILANIGKDYLFVLDKALERANMQNCLIRDFDYRLTDNELILRVFLRGSARREHVCYKHAEITVRPMGSVTMLTLVLRGVHVVDYRYLLDRLRGRGELKLGVLVYQEIS